VCSSHISGVLYSGDGTVTFELISPCNGKIKVASFGIESGRKLTIGVKSVVDIKNGTEEAVVFVYHVLWSL
jgi:hypothetical protein